MKAPGLLPKIIAAFVLASGCTKNSDLEQSRWNGEGPHPSLSADGLNIYTEALSAGEHVQLLEQKVERVPIEDSFVKTVSRGNSTVFQSFAIAQKVSPQVVAEANTLEESKEEAWNKLLKKYPTYESWSLGSPAFVVITAKLKAVLTRDVISKEGEIFSLQFDREGRVSKKIRQGSSFTDIANVAALTFPKGPKKSELSKVVVQRLILPEGLASSQVSVKSESNTKILMTQSLELPPSDERFDQVQVFYFANNFLSWLDSKSLMKSPIKVEILSQVGFPDKTNTAFYYKGQVRLGVGDDITFSKIPWDPSIVVHETAHAVIDNISRLPYQNEGGSINEGIADVMTTIFLESPLLGENAYKKGPFKRTVEPKVTLFEKTGGLYHDSAIVSSFFWKVKSIVGPDKALLYLFKVLNRLAPNTNFADYTQTVREQAVENFSREELTKVQDAMKEWGYL
jgi:Zn-dependent metalloprotease